MHTHLESTLGFVGGGDHKQLFRKQAKVEIEKDCSARLGELVTIGMKLADGSPLVTDMWKKWMARDPRALLAQLMLK